MDDMEIAARRLLSLNAKSLGMPPLAMNIYLDPNGNAVPLEIVHEGSPGGMLGEVEYIEPTPGHGFFVQIAMRSFSTGSEGRIFRLFEINGEGWQIKAQEIDLGPKTNPAIEFNKVEINKRGKEFMTQYLKWRSF